MGNSQVIIRVDSFALFNELISASVRERVLSGMDDLMRGEMILHLPAYVLARSRSIFLFCLLYTLLTVSGNAQETFIARKPPQVSQICWLAS